MEAYRRFKTKEHQPEVSGWYGTDKGELYWFAVERVWSCRNDEISDEYPSLWYKLIADLNEIEKEGINSKAGFTPSGNDDSIDQSIAEVLLKFFAPFADGPREYLTATQINNYIENNSENKVMNAKSFGKALRFVFGKPVLRPQGYCYTLQRNNLT